MRKNYGLPYQGSKNRLAEDIINILPQKKVLVDLFGGGGAISVCASQSGKYEKIIYNELNSLISETFQKAINGEYENERRWVSHEEFDQLKDKDGYVAICFSFSNNCSTYMYAPKIEPYKRAYHYAIVFDDFGPFNELFDDETTEKIKKSVEGITDLKERRLKFTKALGEYILSLDRLEILEHKERIQNLERKERVDLLNKTMSVKNENRGSSATTPHIETQEKFENIKHSMCLGGSPRHINENLECKERIDILQLTNIIEVLNKDYNDVELPLPEDCVIYCDIPYQKTWQYKVGNFDYERFYKWCQEKTSEGYQIFVSSYELPEDLFIEVWSKGRHSKAGIGSQHVIEKIYIPKVK